MPGGVTRWYISLGLALALAVCTVSFRAEAQSESVWVREGLEGSEVRALVVDRDGGRPAALVARGGTESPLRLRGQRGWTQPDPSSLPNLVLALGAVDGLYAAGLGSFGITSHLFAQGPESYIYSVVSFLCALRRISSLKSACSFTSS
ncbi:MAG: hypothetical protein IT307_14250 [Chloroflexi bacterium]|nr:hypothetical protein [Chloroflexota bacterium]